MPQWILDLYIEIYAGLGDRLLVAVAAILIVGIVGILTGPAFGNANPLSWRLADILFGRFGEKLDKHERKRGDLIFRGFLLAMLAVFVFFAGGFLLSALALRFPAWSLIEILSLCLFISVGAVFAVTSCLHKALSSDKVETGAYYRIARSSRSDLSRDDDFTITRIGMMFALNAFDKGLVAPVFWYLIGGLHGVAIYTALAALSWRFSRGKKATAFSAPIVQLEKVLGYIPNVLSGLLLTIAALITPTAGLTRAILGWGGRERTASYEEGGLPVTTAAYALDVTLGGPSTDLAGHTFERHWIGPKSATAQLQAGHLRRLSYILLIAHLVWLFILLGMLWMAAGQISV